MEMSKTTVGQMFSGVMKSAAAAASKAAQGGKRLLVSGGKKAAAASKAIAAIQMPQSLEWIFGFGFKVGIFLLLKSFLILKYQHANLSSSGYGVIGSQVLQAFVLVGCGVLMQNKAFYDEPKKLRRINLFYGAAFALGVLVFVLRERMNLQFFKAAESVNWFKDLFSGMAKGAGEISLSLLFWDVDLWAMLCGLMYFIVMLYLRVSFPPEKKLLHRAADAVRRLLRFPDKVVRIEAAVQMGDDVLPRASEPMQLAPPDEEVLLPENSSEQETA